MKKGKIGLGIIGVGYVGGALRDYFKKKPVKLFLYDKFKKIGSIEEVNRAEIVFVATPTPFNPKSGFDGSFVINAVSVLNGSKIVVIKSTVTPGFTQKLQTKFPQHKFLFNPEFFRESSPFKDLKNPDKQILGVTEKSREVAKKIMRLLPKAPYESIVSTTEAEIIKYMANVFLALKVVYANNFYDLCKVLKINYRKVAEAVVKDPRIGNSHFDIFHNGYRGYGGSCLPKDANALLEFAKKLHLEMPLLSAMRKQNLKYLKNSGFSEEYFLLNKHKKNAK
jgi:UDPglucose 6-dehydrogenase